MRIVFATGIYPPDIGGPASYVHALAGEFSNAGHAVTVVTYGMENEAHNEGPWKVVKVSKRGGPFLRWRRYAKALKREGSGADIVYAFSSVSCGVPVMLARLKGPKKVLRLGGDFFWERYTDRGGTKGLKEWYAGKPLSKFFLQRILSSFQEVVFSTRFEEEIYEREYLLPAHAVIENAVPEGTSVLHERQAPFSLLFLGRFVGFKNLPLLIEALALLPDTRLTLVGSGPKEEELKRAAEKLVPGKVKFLPPVSSEEREKLFLDHDLLVIPSLTELSPNGALEARAAGLPVLLTRETGLSGELKSGMTTADLSTPDAIARAVRDISGRYAEVAKAAASLPPSRPWSQVAKDHLRLFQAL